MTKDYTLAELSDLITGHLKGDPSYRVSGLTTIELATASEVACLLDKDSLSKRFSSKAGVFIVGTDIEGDVPYIVVENPRRALATLITLFYPPPQQVYRISDKTDISPSADCHDQVAIGAFSSVGAGSSIAEHVVIHPNVTIGQRCHIGPRSVLYPGVVLYDDTVLGSDVIIQAGSVIGSTGFGYNEGDDGWELIPHVGRVVIKDAVHIGVNVCVDRGCLHDTIIGKGSIFDNCVQIGHNVKIGENCALVSFAALGGSSHLGDRVKLSSQVTIDSHVGIGSDSVVFAKSGVTKSCLPGSSLMGFPACDSKTYVSRHAFLNQLYKKKIKKKTSSLD